MPHRQLKRAHRIAYELTHGEIPPGLHVLHACDNPPCCNPTHLFLGTDDDNKADMAAKGRRANGERQGAAKLKEAEVLEIRRLNAEGISRRQLAKQFCVSPHTINLICNGQTWKHCLAGHQ